MIDDRVVVVTILNGVESGRKYVSNRTSTRNGKHQRRRQPQMKSM